MEPIRKSLVHVASQRVAMRQSPNLVHVIVMNAVAVTRKNVIHVPEVAQVGVSF